MTVVRQKVQQSSSYKRSHSIPGKEANSSSSKNMFENEHNNTTSIPQSIGGHYGVHGTPQWMAPEVMEGSSYNGKVDVYSYGIVLCEIFSRVLPFSDRYRAFEFIEAVLEQGATPTIPRWCYAATVVDAATVDTATSSSSNGEQKERSTPPGHHNRNKTGSQAIPDNWLSFDWTSSMEDEDEDDAHRLELPNAIQSLRRGTLRKVIIQCLNRNPKERPSFDLLVTALRNVLMPTSVVSSSVQSSSPQDEEPEEPEEPEEEQEDWGMGARIFLEFDLPRIIES